MRVSKTFNINFEKCHLIGTILDNDVAIAVYKTWRKDKRRWNYQSCEIESLKQLIKMNQNYTKIKKAL